MRAAALILAVAVTGAGAKEQKVVCPEEVPAVAVRIAETPPGWSGFVPERFRLRTAGVTVGYLERRAAQLGEPHKLGGGRYKIVYPHLKDRKEEKWVTCEYDGLVLGRRIPDDTAQCTMVYTPSGHDLRTIDITCR